MRLFLAVGLDEAVRRAAEKTAEELRKRVDRVLRGRWVPPSHMHLTIRFIGHVADERVPSVLDVLEPPLTIPTFDVALGTCGVFPTSGPPRVLWIGLKEGLASLQAMHDEFNRRLAAAGVEPENGPFSAHVTLARIKDASRGSSAVVRESIQAIRVPTNRCQISEAVLFESRLSPKGSTYTAQLRIPLRT